MQSVKSEVKNSDSPRMNEMKERKKKRRANMKKELEEKRRKQAAGELIKGTRKYD